MTALHSCGWHLSRIKRMHTQGHFRVLFFTNFLKPIWTCETRRPWAIHQQGRMWIRFWCLGTNAQVCSISERKMGPTASNISHNIREGDKGWRQRWRLSRWATRCWLDAKTEIRGQTQETEDCCQRSYCKLANSGRTDWRGMFCLCKCRSDTKVQKMQDIHWNALLSHRQYGSVRS